VGLGANDEVTKGKDEVFPESVAHSCNASWNFILRMVVNGTNKSKSV